MNILREFKQFSKERGYPKYQAALSHIAFLRTFDDAELLPAKTIKPKNSPYYWKWLTRLPCTGCASKVGVSPRLFSRTGEYIPCVSSDTESYNCIPVCTACLKRPEVILAIKIRYQDLTLSLLTAYLRCVEGT